MPNLLRVLALSTAIAFYQTATAATNTETKNPPSVSETVQAALESLSAGTVEAWRQKAEHGDALAQNVMGMAYTYGLEVPQNHQMSLMWFRRAAEQGHPDAQFNLVRIYGKSEGLYVITDARETYRTSHARRSARTTRRAGDACLDGSGRARSSHYKMKSNDACAERCNCG